METVMTSLPWLTEWLARVAPLVAGKHHAWLLTGRAGDGLREAGRALAQALLCERPQQGRGCGACSSCGWFLGGVHPDCRIVSLDESDEETLRLPTIKVQAARSAIDFAQLSGESARGRVVLVDPADALTTESGNAILKAVEEPPALTRWLLLSERPARILPTLRSRALRLPLPRPALAEARQYLAACGADAAAIDEALRIHAGAPLAAARELAEGAALAPIRARFFDELSQPSRLPALAWGQWVESGARADRRERFVALLRWLLLWLTDWSRFRAGVATRLIPAATLQAVAPTLHPAEALRYHRRILRTLSMPDTTLSARLQVEVILLEFRAVFSR